MPAEAQPLSGSRPTKASPKPERVAANQDREGSGSGSPRGYGQPVATAPPGTRVGWGTILVERLLGDRVLVHVFRLMLVAAIVVLALDLRDMRSTPAGSPDLPSGVPALPTTAPRTSTPAPNPTRSDPDLLAEPMTIDLGPGSTLSLTGTIDVGAALRLDAELSARGEYVTLVELDSPGGSVADALTMSLALRERELSVRVPSGALCASSCPIVLAGGAVREVARDANVGVHQIFTQGGPVISADRAMASAQETTALIARHLDAMGIAPALWFHALETPKDELFYLTPEQSLDYGLATVLLDAAPAGTD